jgi:hypothetical protein
MTLYGIHQASISKCDVRGLVMNFVGPQSGESHPVCVLQALLMMELSFISFEFWTVLFSGSATTLISLYLGKYKTHTATKIPFMYSYSGELRGLSVSISTFRCL